MSSALERRKLASAAARLNAAHAGAGLLPSLVLMTDDERLPDPLAAARALPKGSMVIVRARDAARRAEIAGALRQLQGWLVVLIAGDAALAAATGADGLHLPEADACEAPHWRVRHPRWLITAAAHNLHAVLAASRVDALLLSPVFVTRSHPGRAPLGAVRAGRIAQEAKVPVYALGGIDARNARLLHGFVGIAAIDALAT
ncbi:MAG TPA: thiamine phosphate synthase [Rhizomicrobium sp.]|nr:thiamine phosphate synthase [Rhizomicrobium sp.]